MLVVQDPVEAPKHVTVIRVEDSRYAMALISAAYFDYPAEKLKVIGITGTKGRPQPPTWSSPSWSLRDTRWG